MGFVEAVHDLAGQYGLQVPEDDASPEERARAAGQRQKQATLSEVLEKAGEAYRKQLRQSPARHRLPQGPRRLGRDRPAVRHRLRARGLAHAGQRVPRLRRPAAGRKRPGDRRRGRRQGDGKRYDRFRDRVMFPIRNVKGECIGFGGRVLGDEKPKYLNSPETPVFSKGRELYGLYEARAAFRERGYALVTEGYMDVVALAQLGFPERGRHAGHGLHDRARAEAVPLHRLGGLQLRRRRRRPARRAQGARRRPALCQRRAQRQVPVPAGRARPRQLHPRVRRRRLRPLRQRGHAAEPLHDRGGARGLRPGQRRGPRPHGEQRAPALERAARRRAQAAVAGRNRRAGPAEHPGTERAVGARGAAARGRRAAPAAPRRATERLGYAPRAAARAATGRGARRRRARRAPAAAACRPAGRTWRRGCCCRTWRDGRRCPTSCTPCCATCRASTASSSPGSTASATSTASSPGPPCARACAARPFEALALRVMTGPDGGPIGDAEGEQAADAARELRNVLDYMLDDLLKAQQSEAIAAVGSDPTRPGALQGAGGPPPRTARPAQARVQTMLEKCAARYNVRLR